MAWITINQTNQPVKCDEREFSSTNQTSLQSLYSYEAEFIYINKKLQNLKPLISFPGILKMLFQLITQTLRNGFNEALYHNKPQKRQLAIINFPTAPAYGVYIAHINWQWEWLIYIFNFITDSNHQTNHWPKNTIKPKGKDMQRGLNNFMYSNPWFTTLEVRTLTITSSTQYILWTMANTFVFAYILWWTESDAKEHTHFCQD